ncbi:type I secretion C-terminal target domain-containing protein [Chitinibacter sp. SCUT-21]|uniref:T1SS-143 repeat domain-containing protein n=1 Tax=Chitinibacter sp. SCUT-21 TaxID=2970891 RepID=UPI0035A6FD3F
MAQLESGVIYLLIGDQLWRLLPEGVLELVGDNEPLPVNARIIDIDYGAELAKLSPEGAAKVEAEAAVRANSSSRSNPSSNTPPVLSTSNLASIVALIERTADETIADSGYQTRHLEQPIDLDVVQQNAIPADLIPDNATITVKIADGGDGWINRRETPQVDLSGTTSELLVGQLITLVLTDIEGRQLILTTYDLGGYYQLNDVDLSRLAEGPIRVKATAADPYGNVVSAIDDSVKDTLAEVSPVMLTQQGGDIYIATDESRNTEIAGSVTHVQDGQRVDVTVQDASGQVIRLTGLLIVNGGWSTGVLDLSHFVDGPVTVIASTVDLAGNPAQNTATLYRESGALVTATFADDYIHEGAYPELLNAVEGRGEALFGTINDVENGRTVTLTVTDAAGRILTFTAVTAGAVQDVNGDWQGGSWRVEGADFSSLAPGVLSLQASVTDLAGNTALANDTIVYDPVAQVIDLASNQGQGISLAEQTAVIFTGRVIDIEPGREIALNLSDGLVTLSGKVIVAPDGSWLWPNVDLSVLQEGQLTLTASGTDYAGNLATATAQFYKDTYGTITVEFVDSYVHEGRYPEYLNRLEDDQTVIRGTVNGIEDGQIVTLTVTDSIGASRILSAIVSGGTYSVSTLQLAGLAEGVLTVDALVSDLAGNRASASDTIIHDTLADILPATSSNAGPVINQFEVSALSLTGQAAHIEAGRIVSVVLRDVNGVEVAGTATIEADGQWRLVGLDVSTLSDGVISIQSAATDYAGNPAVMAETLIKDTQAQITVRFVNEGGDDIYSFAEQSTGRVSGSVIDVEDGQTVRIVITDSNNKTITQEGIVIAGGLWTSNVFDFASLAEGQLRVEAWTEDRAGNPATASDLAAIDRSAFIDIDTDYDIATSGDQGIDVWAIKAGLIHEIKGSVFQVEDGQTVTVTLSDGITSKSFTGLVAAGRWTAAIDRSGLDVVRDWTLQAAVQDLAGNSASDETPSIAMSEVLYLSEDQLALDQVAEDTSLLRVTGANAIRFAADQTQLNGITSQGMATTLALAPDGQTLTLTRSDGEIVLRLVLQGVSIKAELMHPVDDAAGAPLLVNYVNVEMTQNETYHGASDTDTILAKVSFGIGDAEPFSVDDFATVLEGDSTSGTVLANDISTEPPFSVYEIIVGGTVNSDGTVSGGTRYAVNPGTPSLIPFVQGNLTIGSDGSWSFVAHRNLDHQIDQIVSFHYAAKDADGDVSLAKVNITVLDGEPGSLSDAAGSFTEAQFGTPKESNYAFTVTAGSDNLDPSTLQFADPLGSLLVDLTALGLKSGGVNLAYEFAGPNTIVAKAAGAIVMTLALSATVEANGDLAANGKITWLRPIDHIGRESFTLVLPVQALDSDGTPTRTGLFSVALNDGANPSASCTQGVEVSETALPEAQNATGTLAIAIGSDSIRSMAFAEASLQPELYSNGLRVQFELSGDGLTLRGFTLNGSIREEIFTVQLIGSLAAETGSTVNYQFTLLAALDQLIGLQHQAFIAVPIVVDIEDFDHDTTAVPLDIKVHDGANPTVGNVELELGEHPVALGQAWVTKQSVSLEVSAAQDPVIDAGFGIEDGLAVCNDSGVPLTQAGVALIWRMNGDGSISAVLSSTRVEVIRLIITEPVSSPIDQTSKVIVTAELYGALDHLPGVASSDAIVLAVPIYLLDSDGSLGVGQVRVTIHDGRDPILVDLPPLLVDEDGLQTNVGTIDTGVILGLKGSDATTNAEFTLVSTLTSGGRAVSIATAVGVDGWWMAQDAAGNSVFRARLKSNGEVDFELLGPLDHPAGDGKNTLDVLFDVRMKDVDGDLSPPMRLQVGVVDDVPVSQSVEAEVTEGQSLSENLLQDNQLLGADDGAITSIIYRGNTYVIPADGSVDLALVDDLGNGYGALTMWSDGRVEVKANTAFNLGGVDIIDHLTYRVTDGDGDVVESFIKLDVRDNDGKIVIEPISTIEDRVQLISLYVDRGDLDNGETVTRITFDAGKLAGGTLRFNGVLLSVDASGNPYLDAAQLAIGSDDLVRPNGLLTFTPALNTSQSSYASPQSKPVIQAAATIAVDVGPDHQVQASRKVVVTSSADEPEWSTNSQFTYNTAEDGAALPLILDANLFDTDGSEKLSYRIDGISAGLSLKTGSTVVTNGMSLTEAQVHALVAIPEAGSAGKLSFELIATATEKDNNDSASNNKLITINVIPAADTPTLTVRNVAGTEDVPIDMRELITQSALTDRDGSETLSFSVRGPAGWGVSVNGVAVTPDASGNLLFSATDLTAGRVKLIPAEDWSSNDIAGGKFTLTVTAIATESVQDGLSPSPVTAITTKNVTVALKGIADEPLVTDGHGWTYDEASRVISGTFNEDELIQLNIQLATKDNQNTESISFLLSHVPLAVQLSDAAGNPLLLPIVGSEDGLPVYQLTLAQLASVYFKPLADFSGAQFEPRLTQINTEPDGDVARFVHQIHIELLPVVDTVNITEINTRAAEDIPVVLNLGLAPWDGLTGLRDIDGSEKITGIVIKSDAGGSLRWDGQILAVGAGLDLAQLAAKNGLTLEQLINAGRLTWVGPEDASGHFLLSAQYSITDTSETGATATALIDTQLNVNVWKQVDNTAVDSPILTRIESLLSTYSDSGSGAITLSGITFSEDDIDGSEYIDQIELQLPAGDGWYIDYPGALHDGHGNWLLQLGSNLTSASTIDTAVSILDNLRVVRHADNPTSNIDLLVKVRVLDGVDAEVVTAKIHLEFTGHVAGEASEVSQLVLSVVDAVEGMDNSEDGVTPPISTTGHINTSAAGDANDVVTFRVMASDLPYGAGLAGADMHYKFGPQGKAIIEYVFTPATLSSLQIVGLDEDFAGRISFPIYKVSTDPSGDVKETSETMILEVEPRVDDIGALDQIVWREDLATNIRLDLNSLLNDELNESAQGKETITKLIFELPADGRLGTLSAPAGVLTQDGAKWVLDDPTQLNLVIFHPPLNVSDVIKVPVTLEITDTTTGVSTVPATHVRNVTATIDILLQPVTDLATVAAQNSIGDEDSYIALTGLSAQLFDTNGNISTESMTLRLTGLPADAVLFVDRGGVLEQCANNGSTDGGVTYSWGFAAADIGNLRLLPPKNFAGDLALELVATTVESGAVTDVKAVAAPFVVQVMPIADGVQLTHPSGSLSSPEGSSINLKLGAETTENPNGNEGIRISVLIKDSSDASALEGILSGRIVGPNSRLSSEFKAVAGGFEADLIVPHTMLADGLIPQSVLESITLFPGASAFGRLDVEIGVYSHDRALVGGVEQTDDSDVVSLNLTIDLTPVASPPILTSEYGEILFTRDVANVPLGLDLALDNPAPGESALLRIQGLPDRFALSAGERDGSDWLVNQSDVASLTFSSMGVVNNFTLTLVPESTLAGVTATGASQSIKVSLFDPAGAVMAGEAVDGLFIGSAGTDTISGGAGNDTLTGNADADVFVFSAADVGSAELPARDQITDFTVGEDKIDLKTLLSGVSTGVDADLKIDLLESGGITTLSIKPNGAQVTEKIELIGVSLDVLYGGSAAGVSEADLLQKLIDEGTLVTQ